MAIDEAMAEVVASSTQPALGAVRLAWWREALERLDANPPPAEPRLAAVGTELVSRGVTGKELAGLEDGWATMLDEAPDMPRIAKRGQRLFAIAAKLLGDTHPNLDAAGRLYGGVDAARRGAFALSTGAGTVEPMGFPNSLRPITALAALAARDLKQGAPFEPQATPGRAWTLLKHRFTGRIS